MAVIAILKGSTLKGVREEKDHEVEAEPDLIVTNTVRLIVPVLQIFAFYVLAHGHVSPGGFQGGVVMGASFILIALSWDSEKAISRFPIERCLTVAVLGILIYGGIGLLSMLLGGEFLDYAELERVLPRFQGDGPLSRHAWCGDWCRVYGLCNYVCPVCESGLGGPVERRPVIDQL